MGQWWAVLMYTYWVPYVNVYWTGVFYIQNLIYGMQYEMRCDMSILIATKIASEYSLFMWLWTGIFCSQKLNYDILLETEQWYIQPLNSSISLLCCTLLAARISHLRNWILWYFSPLNFILWCSWSMTFKDTIMIHMKKLGLHWLHGTRIKMKICTVTAFQNVFHAGQNVQLWERIV